MTSLFLRAIRRCGAIESLKPSNGKSYYPMDGQLVSVPDRVGDRPDPQLLRWDNEHVFGRVGVGRTS
jgi:hypothetical protein